MKRKNANEQKLRAWITERSQSDDPDRAMDEWKLAYMEYGFDRTCPCGKKHITELWYIRNVFNDKLVFVGSKCIERFMGFHPPKGWSTLEKMFMEIPVIPKQDIVDLLPPHQITPWETEFMNSMHQRYKGKVAKLSKKQCAILIRINNSIIHQVTLWSLAFNRPEWSTLPIGQQLLEANMKVKSIRERLTARQEAKKQPNNNRRE